MNKLLFDFQKSKNKFIHEIDFYRTITDDWVIQQFFNEGKFKFEMLLKILLEKFKWKYEFGIYERTDDYFPREFWEMSAELYGRDREGRHIVWHKNIEKYNLYIKDLNEIFVMFFVHFMDKWDKIVHKEQGVYVFKSHLIANIRLEYMKFYKYYPNKIKKIYIVHESSNIMLDGFYKFYGIFTKVKVISTCKSDLVKYIDVDLIPIEFGGKRLPKCDFETFKSIKQLSRKLKIEPKTIEKFYK